MPNKNKYNLNKVLVIIYIKLYLCYFFAVFNFIQIHEKNAVGLTPGACDSL